MFAEEALNKLLTLPGWQTVLDIGSGAGQHTKAFEKAGKCVTAVDLGKSIYYKGSTVATLIGDFNDVVIDEESFDCIWASHVLEHQKNVGLFLSKIRNIVKPEGYVAITVPPKKDMIVGGHLSIWNAGLVLYNLVVSGFDCSSAMVKQYGYNISVIVKVAKIELPELDFDSGDITRLKAFFPEGFQEGFDGNIANLNW